MFFDRVYDTNKVTRGVNTRQFIIVHHTAGGTFESNCRLLTTGARQASVHYVVGPNGEIAKIGEHNMILRHAGESQYGKLHDMNRYSIGIEVVSDGYNYTDKQRKSTRELIKYIMEEEGIPPTSVIRHADITTRKWDIGPNFYNNEFKNRGEYQLSLYDNTNKKMVIKQVITAVISLNSFLRDNIENVTIRNLLKQLNDELRKLT